MVQKELKLTEKQDTGHIAAPTKKENDTRQKEAQHEKADNLEEGKKDILHDDTGFGGRFTLVGSLHPFDFL